MKKFGLVCLICLTAAMGMAQSSEYSLRRIKIRHADPQLIFMLLAGTTNVYTPPEMSTFISSMGGGFGGSSFGGGNSGFGNSGGGFGSGLGGSTQGGSSAPPAPGGGPIGG